MIVAAVWVVGTLVVLETIKRARPSKHPQSIGRYRKGRFYE